MNKIRITCYLIGLMLISISKTYAASRIYWPSFDLPPLFIYDDSGKRYGLGEDLNKHFQQLLPKDEHLNTISSPKKITQDAKQGKNIVITGILKSKKRQDYLYYSKYPCRISWSMVAVIRAEDKTKLTTDGKFSLYKNLNKRKHKFSYIDGIYYDKLTKIIDQIKYDKKLTATSTASIDTSHQINLLANKRIDFFFADPLVVFKLKNQNNNLYPIELVECLELPLTPIYGYYATPKTSWGHDMIEKVDEIMYQTICSGELENIIGSWIPDNLKNRFKRSYRDEIEDKVKCDK
ncbi:hypothetical protein [Maridesulfovibrio sp.]|uniref:hypothetical protein n=1 Tax=unclassified Maridesulfovibrio TaxID=2794999 RepID=UPI003AFFAC66